MPRAGSIERRRARWKLLLLLLVCVSPVVASYFTYYVVRPEGRRNFGTLVQPQRPMPDLATTTPQGHSGSLRSLRDQWLLVSVAPARCDERCQNHLYLQRQMRESLGKEKDRLDWVWLVTDGAPLPKALEPGLQQATVLRVDAAAVAGARSRACPVGPPVPGRSHGQLDDAFPAWPGYGGRCQGQARS